MGVDAHDLAPYTSYLTMLSPQPSGIDRFISFHCGKGCRDVSSKQIRLRSIKLVPVLSIPQSLRVTVLLGPLSVFSITWLILSQRMAWL